MPCSSRLDARARFGAACAVLIQLVAPHASAATRQRSFTVTDVPGVTSISYGFSVPDEGGAPSPRPRPLVLALHPGGTTGPTYGTLYLTHFFAAPLAPLDAIVIAPDCPGRSWTDPASEKAVMALVDSVMRSYPVDRTRVLVVGYSMGGRGTWFLSSRHADVFTAAISIAGSPDALPLEALGRIPTYLIHSRTDQVVPLEPDQRAAEALGRMGRPVRLEVVGGGGHFDTASYREAFDHAVRWVQERWAAR